ncbi:hypothetical protein P872_14130 [Rhodonellum psychrophilum GCM71 = DSM 17998]|uniref:Uncharacterized protein n=1 Tax=Rhodonellum psychrophilum GCM71 = DSM 17998 TaxID=1123057 RepID=U5BIH0_9BACT|nr:hypothetical protein P872_14130 [Rhodonellum psychrophilum GCM71 = DSM 17998]
MCQNGEVINSKQATDNEAFLGWNGLVMHKMGLNSQIKINKIANPSKG